MYAVCHSVYVYEYICACLFCKYYEGICVCMRYVTVCMCMSIYVRACFVSITRVSVYVCGMPQCVCV